MLLKAHDSIFKVPVLAENNILTLKVNNKSVAITSSIERLFIYHLYLCDNKGEVILWLRDVGKLKWAPDEFDLFIDEFIKIHIKQLVFDYSYESIPMQADEHGLDLPIPYYCCTLTIKAERDLMNLFISTPSTKVKTEMMQYLRRYCIEYGYDFSKKGKGNQFEWLYYSFLEQHGIYRYISKPLNDEEKAKISKDAYDKKKKNKKPLVIFISFSVLTLISMMLATEIDSDDHPKWVVFFSALSFVFFGIVGNMIRDYLKNHTKNPFE